jgi:flagellar assembly protein FliH
VKLLFLEEEEKRKLLHNVIKSSKPIRKIRLSKDFVLEEVIDPIKEEEKRKEEEEKKKREEVERKLNEEINKKVSIALEEQKETLYSQFEKGKQVSYKQGFSNGSEMGKKDGKDEIKPILDDFFQIIKKISSEKEQVLINVENEILALCNLIVKKIIKKEVEEDNTIILNIIKESLSFISNETNIILKLNPKDYNTIKVYENELKITLKDIKNFKMEPDEKITQGGCLLETNAGEIDARLETKLKELENMLLKEKNYGS